MSWFQLAVLSIFALALAELTQQHLLHRMKVFNERTSAVLTFLFQGIVALPLLLIFGFGDELLSLFTDLRIFALVLIVDFVAAIGMVYYLRSLKARNISISTILVSFSVIVSTTIGILLLSESFNLPKVGGIVLILFSIMFLKFKNLQFEKNHMYALLAGGMFGVTYSLDKIIVSSIHPIIYIFWSFMFVSCMVFVMGPKIVVKNLRVAKLSDYYPIFLSSMGYLAYNFFTFTAYTKGGEVGRIDAINNSQVFIIIAVEYFIFKQRGGLWKKLLAGLAAFLGVMILGYL